MKLGKLLGAGKSFVNGGKKSAYRADKNVYLPKFSSAKNPFAKAVQTEMAPMTETPAVPAQKADLPTWAKTQKMPAISGSPKSLAAWTSKLNPAALWRSGPPAPAKAVATVQTELSLDKVKVVHNDLTDADVEVVPMKSRPARAEKVPDLEPAKQSWELLGERMMEVKTL